jgi:hypothetical protein
MNKGNPVIFLENADTTNTALLAAFAAHTQAHCGGILALSLG